MGFGNNQEVVLKDGNSEEVAYRQNIFGLAFKELPNVFEPNIQTLPNILELAFEILPNLRSSIEEYCQTSLNRHSEHCHLTKIAGGIN